MKTETDNSVKDQTTTCDNNMLGDVVMIQSNSWNITNKMHLNSINRKNDTLCSKNFSFPESDTDLITYKNGELFKNDSKIEMESLCKRCLSVFLNNIT